MASKEWQTFRLHPWELQRVCLCDACSVAAFISTTEFIFMTLSSWGLDLHHIRLASFSRLGDIMPQSLKSFAGIALKHVSPTKQRDKRNGVELTQCLRVFLPRCTPGSLSSRKLGWRPHWCLSSGCVQVMNKPLQTRKWTFSQGKCFCFTTFRDPLIFFRSRFLISKSKNSSSC